MNVLHPVLIRIPHVPPTLGPQIIARQRDYARIALQYSARLIGAPPGDWPMTAERVPLPRDGFYWSIAHKPRFAAAVVSPTAVGIDLEAITPRGRDLSPAVASKEEWGLLTTHPPCHSEQSEESNPSVNWLAFFQMWTAKEAALKVNGKGIGGLKACRLESITQAGRFVLRFEGRACSVEHFPYAAHIAACTCHGVKLLWQVIDGPTI